MVTGSRRGLIVPRGFDAFGDAPVVLVEGPSDTAACIGVGLDVLGRPSNVGGVDLLTRALQRRKGAVIVLGERDFRDDDRAPHGWRWPGLEGAMRTASAMSRALGRHVYASIPPAPHKDARDWLQREPSMTPDKAVDTLLGISRELLPMRHRHTRTTETTR
ncbi:MAG: hypothetical protein EA379_02865 [Phycisphaerales bacterium]|nr:MAG: hypothetical protein EA379_02865 [Phycisphaerales bacterium]